MVYLYHHRYATKRNPSKEFKKLKLRNQSKAKSSSNHTISICTVGTLYPVISRVAYHLNWKIVADDELWNINWTDSNVDPKICHQMKRFQRINHFPGMHEICRKNLLCRNLQRMHKRYPDAYDFFPETWIFPADLPAAKEYASQHKETFFITKPDDGSQGNGISIVKSLSKVNPFKRMICQAYIQRPLLIDGFKFDLRVYALITSVDPLRIYVYNEGLVRLATKPYAMPNVSNLDERYMHLTNYSINRKSSTYSKDACAGSKRTFASFNHILERDGHDVKTLWSRIDDLVIKTIASALPVLRHSYKASFPLHDTIPACFELLGFDVILDENLKPYLLEVNHSPSFSLNESIDRKVKIPMIRDTLRLLNITSFDKYLILREDRHRIVKRSSLKQKKLNSQKPREQVLADRWLENVQWEEANLGNYRLIMPNPDGSDHHSESIMNDGESLLYSNKTTSQSRFSLNSTENPVDSMLRCQTSLNPLKKLIQKEKRSCKDIARPSGFSPEKLSLHEERNRLAFYAARTQVVAKFDLTNDIYGMFAQHDLLSETDKKKYSTLACSH